MGVPSKEELRNRVIRIIAATRFPFIDQEDWPDDYTTITNESEKRRGVGPLGDMVYPSIIIVDGGGRVREIGEVEDDDSVTEAQVAKWRLLSEETGMGRRTKKFFLYVPEGKGKVAERLLESNNISYAGLRTWAIKGGNLVISPVKTPDERKDHR